MQDPETLRYAMTYKICRIANMISMENDVKIQQITHPYLEQISEIFDESSCVSIERDMEMVYIDVYTGRGRALMSRQRIGNTAPMHCTGNGKLCLLNYSEEQLDRLIRQRGLPQLTEYTLTTKKALMERLEEIRKAGYACDEEECEIGMRCLAYPISSAEAQRPFQLLRKIFSMTAFPSAASPFGEVFRLKSSVRPVSVFPGLMAFSRILRLIYSGAWTFILT